MKKIPIFDKDEGKQTPLYAGTIKEKKSEECSKIQKKYLSYRKKWQ